MSRRPYYSTPSRGRGFPQNYGVLRPATDPNITNDLESKAIQELRCPLDSETKDSKGVEPQDVVPVASYNWTTDQEPTIIVPGMSFSRHHAGSLTECFAFTLKAVHPSGKTGQRPSESRETPA